MQYTNYKLTVTDVNDDNTWEYKWQTANLNIDAGTYTIYAVSDALTRTACPCTIRHCFSHHKETLRYCTGIPVHRCSG